MKKIKIDRLNKERFTDNIISSMHKIIGGEPYWVPSGNNCNTNCGCACAYADQGGSSILVTLTSISTQFSIFLFQFNRVLSLKCCFH